MDVDIRPGITKRPPTTVGGLRELHRTRVARIPCDNLSIMLGRPDPIAAEDSCRHLPGGALHGIVVTSRGLVHPARTAAARDQRDLTSYDERRAALVDDLLLPVADVTDDEWASLGQRTQASHRARDEAGQP